MVKVSVITYIDLKTTDGPRFCVVTVIFSSYPDMIFRII
jgi:hypothetical protein